MDHSALTTVSVPPHRNPDPEQDRPGTVRDGMIFPACAGGGPVSRFLSPNRFRVDAPSPKGRIVNPKTLALFIALLIAAAGCNRNAGPGNTAALEEHFRQSLSGATLVGHFTVGDRKDLREEKYAITKVSKIPGGLWLFQVRIQYGKRDVTLPLPLNVQWAGDTPVITLTDLSIPNLGTYTARVLIYRDQYAGTWSGGDVGGQMFGRVVRDPKP